MDATDKTVASAPSVHPGHRPLVALVGNPNTGKTSVFNMLTGARHRVGNYPGITVERSTGTIVGAEQPIDLLDLPGTYSLAARSPDEMLVTDALLGRQRGIDPISAAVVVIDADNLERNLFLATQILETEVPTVVALNMVDIAARNGVRVDVARLSARLGVPVVEVKARNGQGRAALVAAIAAALRGPSASPRFEWPPAVETVVDALAADMRSVLPPGSCPPRYELLRGLLDVDGYVEHRLCHKGDGVVGDILARHRRDLAAMGFSIPELESNQRYAWIGRIAEECVVRQPCRPRRRSEQIDDIVTHRVLGSIIFCAIMGGIFISVFEWSAQLMEAVDRVFGSLTEAIHGTLGHGMLASFLADGVVAGVGGVLIFLPQILILIGLVTLLEDCGYLARAAFLMDRLLRTIGLGGRSFVPLLSSFACAIPGIMAARTIENPRERLLTILVAPLMACSARIPIYTILVVAFVPKRMVLGFLPVQGLVFAAMYFFGIVVAAGAALVFKKTLFRGAETPFLLELPSYKTPSLRSVALRIYDRGKDFLVSAGTIILAMSVLIWALLYFPHPPAVAQQVRAQMADAGVTDEARIEKEIAGAYLRQSVLARVGLALEPAVRPLGWDWKIGMAALAAFPAREVVVSTLGIIYNLGPDEDATSTVLHDKLRAATWPDGRKVFTLPVALSIMVFFALCCQCQATVAIIKRETNSWRWPMFVFGYMTILAYLAALVVYQIGSRLV